MKATILTVDARDGSRAEFEAARLPPRRKNPGKPTANFCTLTFPNTRAGRKLARAVATALQGTADEHGHVRCQVARLHNWLIANAPDSHSIARGSVLDRVLQIPCLHIAWQGTVGQLFDML